MRWLASIPEKTLNDWIGYYRVEPFGNTWQQSASIAYEVAQHREAYYVAHGTEPDPPKYEEFLPMDARILKKKTVVQTPAQMFATLKRAFR